MQRTEVTPESAGLCGCWQFVAVWRERQILRQGKVVDTQEEYSFYASSLSKDQCSAEQLAGHIRAHWAAIEIGSHHRRDVTLREDACRISARGAAYVLATLRNLVLGIFELQKRDGKTQADYLPGWQRRMTASRAVKLITRGG